MMNTPSAVATSMPQKTPVPITFWAPAPAPLAFILGVVPLTLASGAGAGAQNVMGTGVFWGMLIATALGVFIIPGNYTFVEGLGRGGASKKGSAAPSPKGGH